MPDGEVTISATEFKAKCLALFKALEKRKISRVIVTKRGKPVAELKPPGTKVPSLWGAHPGSAVAAPGVDLTEPVLDEPLDAEHGLLHR
jgi:antitoxin (DNA-binding transcriptional repressor) of toxin-antitoxin stability system